MRTCFAIICCAILSFSVTGCPKNQASPTPAGGDKGTSTSREPDKTEAKKATGAVAEPAQARAAALAEPIPEKPVVELTTSMGKITIELFPKKAPKTVANFLGYVRSGHYKGTIFHRVIDGFMIQGGGFDESMNEKTAGTPIQNEADNGLANDRGTIAMARTPNPHSAAAQFFINVANNAQLNFRDKSLQGWGYCVFGKVTSGMEVVDKIKGVATGDKGPHQNVPSTSIVITDAKLIK